MARSKTEVMFKIVFRLQKQGDKKANKEQGSQDIAVAAAKDDIDF